MMPAACSLLMACLAGLLINPAFAQADYPARTVRIVVGFPPGGSSDVSARVVAERMSAEWKQPVIIENRPGASGTIAAAAVAASPADGYTLLHIGPGTHAITAALYRNLAYDAIKDFTGVGQIGIAPFAIVVGARSPLKTMKQLIEAARSRPGQLSFASSGNGTAPHLITESIASATGVRFFQVAYKGTAPSAMAAITGEVDFATVDSASALSHVRSGQLRVLAITTALRSTMYPGVPTVAETAAPGFSYPSSVGLAAPAGTPREIVQRINGALNRALANEGVRDRLKALGFEAAPVSAQDFDAFIASEVDRYARVVRNLGLKME